MVRIGRRWTDMGDDHYIKIEPICKFSMMCTAAGLMHLVYLITFSFFKMGMLMLFNFFSITVYAVTAIITFKAEKFEKNPPAWVLVVFSEILAHAVLCTIVQGMDVCFYLFPLMGMPLYAYYLFVYCNRRTFVKTTFWMGVITTVTLTAVIVFVEKAGSVYTLTDMHILTNLEIVVIRSINIVFTFTMLLMFTLVYSAEVMRLLGKLRESNQQLNYIATHDALTGLSNRHSLWKFFEDLEQSKDHYCIVMGDLDDFKKINDTYGHDCGDVVLKSVANIILGNTHENDMACRWGGEEMLIVMRGSREECFERLNTIKSQICSLDIKHEEQPVKVTMTFGFAGSEEVSNAMSNLSADLVKTTVRTPSHLEVDSLISMVDKRLYVGKRNGKNVIVAA